MFNSLDPHNGAAANGLTTDCSPGKIEREALVLDNSVWRTGCHFSSSTKLRAIVTRSPGSGS